MNQSRPIYLHPESYGTVSERFQQSRDMALAKLDRGLPQTQLPRNRVTTLRRTPEQVAAEIKRMKSEGIL